MARHEIRKLLWAACGLALLLGGRVEAAESIEPVTQWPSAPLLVERPRWIEAEAMQNQATDAGRTNFPTVRQGIALFNNAALFVDEPVVPAEGVYEAEIALAVARPGAVSVWIAGSPPSTALLPDGAPESRWVSPLAVLMDQQLVEVAPQTHPVVAWYNTGTNAWYRAGSFPLDTGSHRLRIQVAAPRQRDGHYAAEVDSVLLLPDAWTPDLARLSSWIDEEWMAYLAFEGTARELDADTLRQLVLVLRARPDDLEALLNLARFLRQGEVSTAAAVVYRRILAADPLHPQALDELAQLASQLGAWTEAAELYGVLVTQRPNDAALKMRYAEALEATGHLADAARVYEQLLVAAPDDATLLAKLWDLAHARDHANDAVHYGQRLRQLGKLSPEQQLQLGPDLEAAGRLEDALALYKQLDPTSHIAVQDAIDQLIPGLPDPIRQAQEYAALLEVRPNDSVVRLKLAEALEAAGLVRDALEQYHRMVQANPDDRFLLKRVAERSRWVNRLDDAIDAYQHLLELSPNDVETRHALLDTFVAASRHREAIEEARILLQSEPGNRELHLTLGRLLTWTDQPQAAIAAYEQALLVGPDEAPLHVELGRLHDGLGHQQQAIAQYRTALQLDPNNREAADLLRLARAHTADQPPTLSYSYFEDSRHVVRWQTSGRVQWYLGDDPMNVQYGVLGLHDRTQWVNGQWIQGGWEHRLSPEWWVGTDQGLAVYDHDFASYHYSLRMGYDPSDRWHWLLENRRDDVWETPEALEQGISFNETRLTSTIDWTDRFEQIGSIAYDRLTDHNSAFRFSQEWIYRLFDEPFITVGGGYLFDDFRRAPDPSDIYYSPESVHTGFLRGAFLHHPAPNWDYGGEYVFGFDDQGALSHGIRGQWDLRIIRDLWFQLYGRYFFDSVRFEGERYFEREFGANLKWKF